MENYSFVDILKKPDEKEKYLLDRETMFVIFDLFEKTNGNMEKSFTEEELINYIMKYHKYDKYVDNIKQIISNLQDYYIVPTFNKEYTLRSFAIKFARLFKEEVKTEPSDFQKPFFNYYSWLKKCKEEDEGIETWIKVFDNFKFEIFKELDNLLKQIRSEIKQFKEIFTEKSDNYNIYKINKSLDNINKQTDEFKIIFHFDNEISKLMRDWKSENATIQLAKKDIDSFFLSVNQKILYLRNKIDHIKPRLNQFIKSAFSHNSFNRKIEEYFRFLLQNSEIEKKGNTHKIIFPVNIPNKAILLEPTNFIAIKELNRIKQNPKSDDDKNTDKEQIKQKLETERKKQFENYKKNNEIEKKIRKYLIEADKEINSRGVLIFENLFYLILNTEKKNLYIATCVAYELLKKYRNENEFKIDIVQNIIEDKNKDFKNFKLWQMKIHKI